MDACCIRNCRAFWSPRLFILLWNVPDAEDRPVSEDAKEKYPKSRGRGGLSYCIRAPEKRKWQRRGM